MAGRIFGKVDCYSELNDPTSAICVDNARSANEVYVGLYTFLQTLEANGVTELVAMHTGNLSSGTPGVGYWDSLNPAGSSSFSVWRWKANANRPWDWYMYIHLLINQTTTSTTVNSVPTFYDNGSSGIDAYSGYILMSYAIAATSSSYANPWNGTTDKSGAAYKGYPVWSTGALNHICYAFPRQNSVSPRSLDRALADSVVVYFGNGNRSYGFSREKIVSRYHFLADEDSFLFLLDYNYGLYNSSYNEFAQNYQLYETYQVTYAGAFELSDAVVSQSIGQTLGGGKLGFCCFQSKHTNDTNDKQADTIPLNTDFGSTTLGSNPYSGGMLATLNTSVRKFRLGSRELITSIAYHNGMTPNGNFAYTYPSLPFSVVSWEDTTVKGVVGWLNSPIFRCITGLPSHAVQGDGLQAVFGGNQVPQYRKIITAWSGSRPGTNFTRTGRSFILPDGY